jgi:hypothetical protein
VRRVLTALVLFGVASAAWASPAAADAPSPTDYRSEVLSVEPASDAFEVRFIGGDNLVEMVVAPGNEVVVIGYRGEPYLWFRFDGTVVENRRSPSTYLNEDRYGTLTLPEEADPDAEPRWVEVAADGVYVWHDHRTHWMNEARPIGAEPGDQILEAVVPLDVDGERVQVRVGSWWVDPPSVVPSVAGAFAGVALSFFAVARGRRATTYLVIAASTAALVVGGVAWFSVPSITGPSPMTWLPALVALIASVVAAALDPDSEMAGPTLDWLLAAAGAALLVWAWQRDDALVRAILPTDLPGWLERAVVGAVYPIAVTVVASSLWQRVASARTSRKLRTS